MEKQGSCFPRILICTLKAAKRDAKVELKAAKRDMEVEVEVEVELSA
jgi:hypothetical protein